MCVHHWNDASLQLDTRVFPQAPPPILNATFYGRLNFAGLSGKGVERRGVWGEENGGKRGIVEVRITVVTGMAFWRTGCLILTCYLE
jgi:anti-sigma-K factor RskA